MGEKLEENFGPSPLQKVRNVMDNYLNGFERYLIFQGYTVEPLQTGSCDIPIEVLVKK